MTEQKRLKSLLRLGATLAAATLLLGACGSSTANGKKTYTLAWAGALTGDDANLGINGRNGALTAVKQFNAANSDIQIKLTEKDTQGDPAQASTVSQQFITDPKVLGLIGPMFSGETKAILPSLQQNGLVMISPSATNVKLPTIVPNETVFHRVLADDNAQGQGIADYLVKALKPQSVAYVDDNSDYGKGLANSVQQKVSAAGIKTATTDEIDPKAQDFSAAVNKVKSAKPDVIMYGGYYAQAGELRKQLVDAGEKATFITGDGSLDQGILTAGGSEVNGIDITCPCNLATTDSPGALGDFAKAYKADNNADPGTYSAEAYDAANILMNGIKQGNTSRKGLLDYVNHMGPYAGISKQIQFTPNGNITSNGVFFFQTKNGKIELLGTSDSLIK